MNELSSEVIHYLFSSLTAYSSRHQLTHFFLAAVSWPDPAYKTLQRHPCLDVMDRKFSIHCNDSRDVNEGSTKLTMNESEEDEDSVQQTFQFLVCSRL